VESFNSLDGNRTKHKSTVVDISVCDFNISQKTIIIGLSDGGVKIIDMETLNVRNVFIYDGEMGEEFSPVTAVNCQMKDQVVVGYDDGKVREFSLTNPSQFTTFTPTLENKTLIHSAVSFICCITKSNLILSAYNLNKEDGRIFGYKSGTTEVISTMKHTAGKIIEMKVLERIQLLITLSDTNNELSIYDYTNAEQLINLQIKIPTVTDNSSISAFTLLGVTKQVWQSYTTNTEVSLDQPESKPKGDIIVFGLSNGTILTAYISLKLDKEKLSASILPQKIYKAQETNDLLLATGIRCLYIDAFADYMLAGDERGNIVGFNRAVMQILNPSKAQELQEHDQSQGWLNKIGWGFGSKGKDSSPKKEANPIELQLEEMPSHNK